MTRFVLDAPALLHVVRTPLEVHPSHQLVAPQALRSQALALLYTEVRRGLLEEPDALRLHTRLTELRVRLLGDRVSRRTAWTIAREQDWDSPALAEHVALTRLQADALVTTDPDHARRAQGLVPLAPVEALTRP